MDYYKLLDQFGYRETQGYGRTPFALSSGIYPNNFHDGRDYTYRSVKNNACKVLISGRVTFVGFGGKYGQAYGNLVEMEVAPNTFLVYCHLASFNSLAKVGDMRLAGDDIGIIGISGTVRSTGIHVHLLGRENGNRVDPKVIVDKLLNNKEYMDKQEIRAIVEGVYWSFGLRQPDVDGVSFWVQEYSREAEKAKWLGRIMEGLRAEKTVQGIRFLDGKENRWRSEEDIKGR